MGAVIPARKRVAVGQFLGQGGYLPEWLTPPLNPPEKGQGGDDAPGASGGGENFFAEFQGVGREAEILKS